MKFLLNDLKKFIDVSGNITDIVDVLPKLGMEVENFADNSGIIVAKIINIKPHENSDRLNICTVDYGSEENLEIICGADNVRVGLYTVLALVGSFIPLNNMKIEPIKIRGVKSHGMLCSKRELGLGDEHAGIIELDESAFKIGEAFLDSFIDVDITPNRGDWLAVIGIARELATAGLGRLKNFSIPEIKFALDCPIKIKKCENDIIFSGIYIKGIDNKITTPKHIVETLKTSGITSVSIVVDIMNYVAVLFNRPLHAYDADTIKNNDLYITCANEKRKFLALDNIEYEINIGDIIVSDEEKIHGLAGIIGADCSKCTENTTNIFIESAVFDHVKIALTSRALSINTDSKYRFERMLDKNFVVDGLKIAAKMVQEICGGEASSIEYVGSRYSPKIIEIDSWEYFSKISGVHFEKSYIVNILKSLGFVTYEDRITVPSWRNNVETKDDILSDILRFYGYDNLPYESLNISLNAKIPKRSRRELVNDILVNREMNEVITWSFMSSDNPYIAHEDSMYIVNPVTTELNYMRPSIIFNLVDVYKKNYALGTKSVSIFEYGPVFSTQEERNVLTGLRVGDKYLRNIHGFKGIYDVFDVKADVENILNALKINRFDIKAGFNPSYYSPNKSGGVFLGKMPIAYFGELDVKYPDIKGAKINIFEIFIDKIPVVKQQKASSFKVSSYPEVHRDFGFIFTEIVIADNLIKEIAKIDKKLIKNVRIFDKFIVDDKLSLAFEVVIQSQIKTMEGHEIDEISNNIISVVQNKFNGVLRRDFVPSV
ncbi:phenylalanine--tRNA ligase subunit beta [Anaplasmataceae bacterium AB001_6]|nr:phenylalanine--tRNA ligase subunit beta [Anaplasmataceae bacterium AB001_6]